MWRISFIILIFSSSFLFAQSRSLLDDDPEVIYLDQHIDRKIELIVAEDANVFATKTANRHLGVFAKGTKVELLAMTDKAYRVRGQAKHAGVAGWVSPKLMASTDKDFIENLKKLYERQMIVTALINNKEVAIGMTLDEVSQSLGEPSKKSMRQTKDGVTGSWEFIQLEEKKHYRAVRDIRSGQVYQQLSHTTVEEKGKIVVEFEGDVVTALEESENNSGGRIKIITPPIVWGW